MASTSFIAQAEAPTKQWLFGDFNQNLWDPSGTDFWGLIGNGNTGNSDPSENVDGAAGLTLELTTDAQATGAINFQNLGLVYTEFSEQSYKDGFIPVTGESGVTSQLSVLTVVSKSGTPTLNLKGLKITGGVVLPVEGLTNLFNKGITVLTVGGGDNTVSVSNTGAVEVNFSATGTNLKGLYVVNGSSYSGSATESYTVNSNFNATALDIRGTGTWTAGTGNKNVTFTASATAGNLAKEAEAIGVSVDGTLVIGSNVTVDIDAILNTGTPAQGQNSRLSATGLEYSSSAAGYIGTASSNENFVNSATVNIDAALTVTNAGDLQAQGTVTAIGVSNEDDGNINILAGTGAAGNTISATVSGGALTQGASTGAYAVMADDTGDVNIALANSASGTASNAVLNISATNTASFATGVGGTATAAAIYADGTSEVSTITVNGNAGTVNISAEAGTDPSSKAYAVWAQAGEAASNVSLYGTNQMTIGVVGGAANSILDEKAPIGSYQLVETLTINNAAIYANNVGGNETEINIGVANLSINGDVIALRSGTEAVNINFSGAAGNFTGLEVDGLSSAPAGTDTNTTITGNLWALNGGKINVGAYGNTKTDAVTVTGNTYILGQSSSNTSSWLYVEAGAIYTAQGETIAANGGEINVNGTYIANGPVTIGKLAGNKGGIELGSDESAGTMIANSTTIITQGGKLEIASTTEDAPSAYFAYGDMIIGDQVSYGPETEPTVTGTVKIDGALYIGDGAHATTTTVNLGGQIEGSGNFFVQKEATIVLTTAPNGVDATSVSPMIKNTVNSSVYGTVQISGSSQATGEQTQANFYQGGLGSMSIEDGGTLVGDEGGLYLGLISGDKLIIDGTMDANAVNVGIDGKGGSLHISGGNVEVGNLTISAGDVTLLSGTLTLGAPTDVEGQNPKSSLTITDGELDLNGGVLVTASQNIWKEAASTPVGEENLSSNLNGEKITIAGVSAVSEGKIPSIELTDKKVDVSWLKQAQKGTLPAGGEVFSIGTEGKNITFIIEGLLYDGAKKVTSVIPQTPQAGMTPAVASPGFDQLMSGGGALYQVSLNANDQKFTPQSGGTATVYQNLVIGGTTPTGSNVPDGWDQDKGSQAWSINPANGLVGFSSVSLGEGGAGGDILITGGKTLVLTGTGPGQAVVSGAGNEIYVGLAAQDSQGTFVLGSVQDTGTAKGGSINGNINVTNGTLQVQYSDYVLTDGALTLGVKAKGTQVKPGTPGEYAGSIEVTKGTFTVPTIVGNTVNSIDVEGQGAALNVQGDMTATLQKNFVEVQNGGALNVDGNLDISIAKEISLSGLSAEDSVVQVGKDFTSTNATVSVEESSMTVGGNFTQQVGAGNAPNQMYLALNNTKQGKAATLKVVGDLSTSASTVMVTGNSTISAGGKLSITGQTTANNPKPTANIILNGGTVTATNIELTNAQTTTTGESGFLGELEANSPYASYYSNGNIQADNAITLTNTTLGLDSGSITSAEISIDPKSTLSLGMTAGDLETVNQALTKAFQQPVDTMVATGEFGTLSVAGNVNIQGVAPATATENTALTRLAIGNLQFQSPETGTSTVSVGNGAALILGNSSVDSFDRAVLDVRAPEGTTFTSYLKTGQSVQMGENTSLTIGTVAGTAGALNIGANTAVAIDARGLANNQNAPTARAAGNGAISLFSYTPTDPEATAPTATISPDAYFLIVNPLGKMKINVADGFTFNQTVSSDQLLGSTGTTNPLYNVSWDPDGATDTEGTYELPTLIVAINQEEVRNGLRTLVPNTIIDAAENFPYGTNEGADRILDLLSTVQSVDDYTTVRNTINGWALMGAAAHAHEVGISAASMIVDSVWDHSSKLAAAPHERTKADVWITLDWNHSRANDYKAGGLDNGYKLDLYGATFGADYDFANGLTTGLAVSVGGGDAKSKGFNEGQKTDVTYWGINLYGTYACPFVNVIGNVGYIGVKNKTKTVFGKGRPDANIWTVGVKMEKDFAINEQFTVTPHVGIRYLSVDVDDFNLGGFHYGTDKANLVQFPLGVAFAANLKTANGAAVKPFLDLTFVPTAGDKKVDNTFGISGGTMNDVIDTTIASTAMFQGKIGVNASYGAHNFGLNFAIGGGNKGRLDTGLQAKYRFVF